MSEIPRYKTYGRQDNEHGTWIQYDYHVAAVKAAVLAERIAERERCLEIVEKHRGYSVNQDGMLAHSPYGELITRFSVVKMMKWDR